MALFCKVCARRVLGMVCKCGAQDVERVPPLDGIVFCGEEPDPQIREEWFASKRTT